jgi:hypothetical protein
VRNVRPTGRCSTCELACSTSGEALHIVILGGRATSGTGPLNGLAGVLNVRPGG